MNKAVIPDKLYYKIGEVAQITFLRPSILRYWETEFDLLKPAKSSTGQRLYSAKDLLTVLEIKRLLYTEKLTIEGARKKLTGRGRGVAPQVMDPHDAVTKIIYEVRDELLRLRESL